MAATTVVDKDCVNLQPIASMGSEDFAFMLQEKPGCYAWIGNGPSENSCLLHNPHYDFNDEILPIGAAYWARLVENSVGRLALVLLGLKQHVRHFFGLGF